jgi:hypothetical protein
MTRPIGEISANDALFQEQAATAVAAAASQSELRAFTLRQAPTLSIYLPYLQLLVNSS